jgi:hypothetical protein
MPMWAGQKDPWYGDKSQSTLWQEKKPAANRLHPTMKPVELVERALANSSKAGDMVMDLFGGSGSTLIACERRDRTCRLMELDPRYVDVIIRPWQEYTGKTATLDTTGQQFDDVARERAFSVRTRRTLRRPMTREIPAWTFTVRSEATRHTYPRPIRMRCWHARAMAKKPS